MKNYIAVALLTVGLASAAAATPISGPTVNPANGSTYYLLSQNDWANSQAEALSLGGHLVTIDDQAENDWVFGTFSNFGGVDRALWIGLTDQTSEGTFGWASGSATAFTLWSAGQPDNGATGPDPPGEDFVHMLWPGHVNAGSWNDFQNLSSVNDFVLNGVVEVIPEPSTATLFLLGLVMMSTAKRHRSS